MAGVIQPLGPLWQCIGLVLTQLPVLKLETVIIRSRSEGEARTGYGIPAHDGVGSGGGGKFFRRRRRRRRRRRPPGVGRGQWSTWTVEYEDSGVRGQWSAWTVEYVDSGVRGQWSAWTVECVDSMEGGGENLRFLY